MEGVNCKNTSAAWLVKRKEIIALHAEGHTISYIAREVGVTRKTALKWIIRHSQQEDMRDHRGGKPPQKTTAAQDREIIAASSNDPKLSAVAIKRQLQLDISEQTVRRRLHRGGRHPRSATMKAKITAKHVRERLLLGQESQGQALEFGKRDNVTWDKEQEEDAKRKVIENSEIKFSSSEIEELKDSASTKWDKFYGIHQNRFFKDRHWLFTEFKELSESKNTAIETNDKGEAETVTSLDVEVVKQLRKDEDYPGQKSSFKILEVGCGVGNTVFPILEKNINPNLFVYCCDFSEMAINIVKESENYNQDRCRAFVCDLTADELSVPFPQESLDVIVCIFVLSALPPERLKISLKNLVKYLKPGGTLLFRDYGRYDMAQLRFKNGRCLGEHFYARGDGTLCYFFTQDEVKEMMEEAGLEELQNLVDRRLQVNRGKQLTMYRVWIQAKYRKPL